MADHWGAGIDASTTDSGDPSHAINALPKSTAGWLATGLTAAVLLIFFVLPALPGLRAQVPILGTAFVPLMLVVTIDVAALEGLVAVVKRQDRSLVTMVVTVVAVLLAAAGTLVVVASALFPSLSEV